MSPNVIIHPDNSVVRISGPGVSIGEAEVAAEVATRAAADTAINTKIGSGVYQVFNIEDYGAVSDGSTNNSTAIQAAIDAIPATGGTLFVPGTGDFRFATTLDFSNTVGVRVVGASAPSAGTGIASQLTYTGAGTAINATGANGLEMRDLMLTYTVSTGTLVNFDSAVYATVTRCYVGGAGGIDSAALLFNLDELQIAGFHDSVFAGAAVGFRGKDVNAHYTNQANWHNCTFKDFTTMAVRDPGEAFSFYGCTFQQIESGAAGAIDHTAAFTAKALNIHGCWFGDANTSGTWITFSGNGLTILGSQIGGGNFAIDLGATDTKGVTILGNHFESNNTGAARISTGAHRNFLIMGNTGLAVGDLAIQYAASSIPTNSLVQDGESSVLPYGILPRIAGVVSDASFATTPPDGTYAYDSTNNRLYVRSGGSWKVPGATPPACRVYRSTNDSAITTGNAAYIAFDNESFDTDTIHDNATNNSRLTATTAGVYAVYGVLMLAANTAAANVNVYIYVNGAQSLVVDMGAGVANANISGLIKLAATDYVQLRVANGTGSTITPYGGGAGTTSFGMTWMGAG